MAYLRVIETTQNWTCPKTGDYKIICVAGGQSGKGNNAQVDGGTTSFGSYLVVSGYNIGSTKVQSSFQTSGGWGGYTLINYGGSGGNASSSSSNTASSINGGISRSGQGWGAGGFGWNTGGYSGKLSMIIVSITAGTVISCVVGKGGVTSEASANDGNDGVIVIQEV